MSGFLLPGEFNQLARQSAQDIAEAWRLLLKICAVRQYPFDIAEAQVQAYLGTQQLSEIEAIRKVYHEVAYS
jgi:hypothetical protein